MLRQTTVHVTVLALLLSCNGPSDPKVGDTSAETSTSLPTDTAAVDLDGDGVVAADDCDDDDASVGVATEWYVDTDGDGHGVDSNSTVFACEPPSGYVASADDCDDGRGDVYPGAPEVCDGIDQDCDGEADSPDPIDGLTVCEDGDGDGFGDPATCSVACDVPSGFVDNADDCDDLDAMVSPAADELCNDIDDDCDGTVDDDIDVYEWFVDDDGDGFGDPEAGWCGDVTSGVVEDSSDCDDTDPEVHPGASDTCDGVDQNCNGVIDDGTCPCPVESYGGHAYQVCASSDRSWEDASAACTDSGYALVSLQDSKESAWLADTLLTYGGGTSYWTGLNDRAVEGAWEWADGSPVTFTAWNSGEPNGGESENCVEMYIMVHGWFGVWNDESCGGSKRYVCEAGP